MSDQRPRSQYLVLLDEERSRRGPANDQGDTRVSPPPDVPDAERPLPRQGAPTGLDRALGAAPSRHVVQRVKARHEAAQEAGGPSPERVPYDPPKLILPPPLEQPPPKAWPKRLWDEVKAAWLEFW